MESLCENSFCLCDVVNALSEIHFFGCVILVVKAVMVHLFACYRGTEAVLFCLQSQREGQEINLGAHCFIIFILLFNIFIYQCSIEVKEGISFAKWHNMLLKI